MGGEYMVINFYRTLDEPRKINKTLIYVKGFNNLPLKQDMNVLEPEFYMTWDGEYNTNINYCYIEDFKRYYFVKLVMATGGRVLVKCAVDVLMSHANDIKKCSIYTRRQGNNINNLIHDGEKVIYANRSLYTRLFPKNLFNTQTIVLYTVGG